MERTKQEADLSALFHKHFQILNSKKDFDFKQFTSEHGVIIKAIQASLKEVDDQKEKALQDLHTIYQEKEKIQRMLQEEIQFRKDVEKKLEEKGVEHYTHIDKKITNIKEINREFPEGRLLMASLVCFGGTRIVRGSAEEMIPYLNKLAAYMHYSGEDRMVNQILSDAVDAHTAIDAFYLEDKIKEAEQNVYSKFYEREKYFENEIEKLVKEKNECFDNLKKMVDQKSPDDKPDLQELTADVITVEDAMHVVCHALKTDPEYRIGWIANIAMAFYDRYQEEQPFRNEPHRLTIHAIANKAALSFLRTLTRDYTLTDPQYQGGNADPLGKSWGGHSWGGGGLQEEKEYSPELKTLSNFVDLLKEGESLLDILKGYGKDANKKESDIQQDDRRDLRKEINDVVSKRNAVYEGMNLLKKRWEQLNDEHIRLFDLFQKSNSNGGSTGLQASPDNDGHPGSGNTATSQGEPEKVI